MATITQKTLRNFVLTHNNKSISIKHPVDTKTEMLIQKEIDKLKNG